MVSVWLVSAAWRRPAVTDLVLEQRQHLIAQLASCGIDGQMLIVADDENLDVAVGRGAEILEHPNLPLGEKWNAGIEYACRHGAEHVVYIGSDDWMHESLFDDGLPDAQSILSGRRIAFLNLPDGRMQTCRIAGRKGVIPWVIPTAMLARCEYRPILTRRAWGLDNSLFSTLHRRGRRPNPIFRDPHPLARVDIKSETNITRYDRLVKHLADGPESPDPWLELSRLYPAGLVARARELSEEAACRSSSLQTA